MAKTLLVSMAFQIVAPFIPVISDAMRVEANGMISETRWGDSLFENVNPDFKAEFGDRQNPTGHRFSFEREGKGIELRLIEASASADAHTPGVKALPTPGVKEASAAAVLPPSYQSVLDEVQEGVASFSAKVEDLARRSDLVMQEATDVRKELAEVLDRPQLTVKKAAPSSVIPASEPGSSAPRNSADYPSDTVDAVEQRIAPDQTITYEVIPAKGVKESIIISDKNYNSSNSYNSYTFLLTLSAGVQIRRALDGPNTIYFTDERGRYLYHFEEPFMVDAAGARSSAVELTLDNNQTRIARLTLTADNQWLSSPERVFPITIDPTIVHEAKPDFTAGTENRSQTTNTPAVEIQYKELQPDINTVGLWHFNEGTSTTAYDASGNAKNGTLTNGPVWNGPTDTLVGLGKSNLSFDNANDYVAVGALTSSAVVKTVEFWTYPKSTSTEFVDLNASAYINVSSGTIGTTGFTSPTVYVNGAVSSTLVANQWQHVAVTTETALNASATNFGKRSTSYLNGYLDEVRISNKARTPEEIAASASRYPYAVHESPVIDFGSTPNSLDSLNYSATGVQTGNGETPFSSDGLVAQWNFNETSGTTAYNTGGADSCGGTPASCNGTLTSFASTSSQDQAAGTGWTANNRRWPSSSAGGGAGALMFDGTNDYVIIADNSSITPANAISFGAWIKPSKIGPSIQKIIAKSNEVVSATYDLDLSADGTILCRLQNVGTNIKTFSTTTTVSAGQWSHVFCTYDGSIAKIYINGQLSTSAYATGALGGTTQLMIGAYLSSGSPTSYFSGVIDSVGLYSRALTAAEILSNAQSGNIEFQTRTGATSTPNDGTWEAWRASSGSGDTQLTSNDSGQYDTTDANMVSYWKLDGNATDAKDSNNGTITEASSTNGRFSTGYNFDGTNDVITVTQAANINLTSKTAYTIESWFKADTDGEADVGQIVQKGAATFIRVDTQGTDATLDVEASFDLATTDATLNITDAAHASNWTHVALVYEDDADDEITLYINGINMGSSTNGVGSPATDSNDLLIGGATTANFDGVIDEVAIWNDARTAAEVAQDAYWAPDLINNAAAGGITTSQDTATKIEGTASEKLQIGRPQCDTAAVALYHLEETSSAATDAKDSCGSFNSAAITGTTIADGFFGKTRSFDGTDDYVDIGTGPTSVKSVDFWVNPTTTTEYFVNTTSTTTYIWANAGTVTATGFTSPTIYVDGSVSSAIVAGKWQHVAVTSATAVNASNLDIGRTADVNYLEGKIDEVRLSSDVRSAEEIAEAYRAGRDHRVTRGFASTDLSGKTKLPFYVASDRPGTYLEATIGESALVNYEAGDADLKGLWHLDENSNGSAAVTRKDSSGNGNNLTDNNTIISSQGKIGKAGDFERDNSEYLSITDNAAISTGDISFSGGAWVNMESESAGMDFMGKMRQDEPDRLANREYQLGYAVGSDQFHFNVFNSGGSGQQLFAVPTVTTNTWYYVIGTYDATADTSRIYINGVLSATLTSVTGPNDTGQTLTIGATSNTSNSNAIQFWDGLIDEVVFIKRTLTPDEIRQAYEIGKRTHPVTIDFTSAIDSTNLITSASDLTFALSSNIKYQSSNINIGEKIIVRENVGGTEYIAQGTVSSITYGSGISNANAPNQALTNAASTVVTVTSWDGGSTFPTGGFTLMAAVFKWQREFMDLSPISLSSHRDAITRITLRVTDGSAGATVWLDDFESADYSGGPSTGSGSTSIAIGSTVNRYFQYRAILTSKGQSLEGQSSQGLSLLGVQVNYNSGTTPQPPRTKDASSDFSATGASLDRITDTGSANSPSLELAYKELPKDINTVGLWHMNENAANTCTGGVNDVCDASGNTNDGAFNGNAAHTTSSKLGASATTYDGTGDYTSVADSATLDFAAADNFTVELWAKHNGAISAVDYLLTKADATTGGYKLYMDASGDFCFDIDDDAIWTPDDTACTSAIDYDDSNWHHVVGVKRGTTDIRLYVDGVEVASDTAIAATATLANTNALYVGIDRDASTGSWDGQIDEVRISNVARTPEEIKLDAQRRPYGVYTSDVQNLGTNVSSIDNLRWTENGVQTGDGETPYSTNGLVAQWNFNETSGGTASNAAGAGSCGGTPSNCNGTLNNFASTSSQDQAAGTGWTKDNRRWGAGALMFDGSNDLVSIANNSALNLSLPYSLEFWMKANDSAAFDVIISRTPTVGSAWNYLITTNDTGGQLRLATGGAGYNMNQVDVTDGNWHYVSVTITSGGTLQWYVDGLARESYSSVSTSTGTSVTCFGDYQTDASTCGSTYDYNGTLDTFRIYSRALSAAEILANYQAGNIELQTRTGTDSTPNDGSGWEDWKPAASQGAEQQLDALDSPSPISRISQNSLTAYWTLDETSGSRADSKGANTLTDNNTVTYAPGRLGNAGQFTRANSEYLSIADNADVSTGNISFSVSSWVYLDSIQSIQPIIGKVDVAGTNREYDVTYRGSTTNRFEFDIWASDGTYQVVQANNFGAATTGTWYFVTAWVDTTANTINIQVNNGAVDSATKTKTVSDGNEQLRIGNTTGGGFDYWNGKIDEVGFWKRTLTAAERTRLFEDGLDLHGAGSGRIYRTRDTATKIEGTASEKLQIGRPQCDTASVALYHLEETSSAATDAKDSCGSFNSAAITGTTITDGFFGKTRSFDGTDDYVDIGAGPTSVKSVDFWVNPTTTTEYFVNTTSTTTYIWANAGTVTATGFTSPTIYVDGSVSSTIVAGKWQHVAVTSATAVNASNLDIGRTADANYLEGKIDEVRLSSDVRTAEEIAEAYRAGRDHRLTKTLSSTDLSSKVKLPFYVASDRTGTYLEATVGESAYANYEPDGSTKGLWHLEEQTGSGAYFKDSSGLGMNGTPTGTAFIQAKIGKGRDFTANTDIVTTTTNNTVYDWSSSTDVTLDGWYYWTSAPATEILFEKWDATNGWTFYTKTATTGLELVLTSASVNTATIVSNAFTWPTNQWVHVALTKSGNTYTFYFNGQSVGSTTNAAAIGASAQPLVMGKRYNGTANTFTGNMDEPRYSSVARSADEIRQAYEIGKRTHPVTIDFVSSPQAAYSSGTSVTINNPYGTTNLTDTLSVGDTMIFKENVGGTETVSQATVNTIANTSSTYGTVTLASAPTFPSGGYTTAATVFKWQREFFDISQISPISQRDAISRITLRITDGSQGSTVWLDDFKSAGPYLSVGSARTSTITSTPQQYFQYRAIISTTDTTLSPSITHISLQFHSDPKKVLGADTFASGTYDNDGNVQLGSNNVKDVQFYDRTKDQISYALETDGTNDFVDIGTGPTSVKTVEFWVYPETTTEYFINTTSTTTYIWANAGTVTATGFTSPTIYVDGAVSSTIVADQWQHVAVTSATAVNASNLDIGRTADANYLEGKIDEVALFSDVRTAVEVVNDYNNRRISDSEDALVAVYHFDEGSGTRAYDSAGTFHGTLTSMTDDDWVNSLSDKDQSALSQQVLGVDPNWANGPARQSYAVSFDGGDNISTSLTHNYTSGITFETWLKTTVVATSYFYGDVQGTTGTQAWITASGTVSWLGYNSGLKFNPTSTKTVNDGNWHHIALVWDGTTSSNAVKMYIDGVLETQGTSTSTWTTAQCTLNLGDTRGASCATRGIGEQFNGILDEVTVFSATRTAAQISSDYNTRRFKGNESNLVGLWHLDEGADNLCSGGTNDICDASSSAADGAQTGGITWTTDARAIMDNNARYVSLGSSSAVNTDRGMEIKITSTTAFQYRWQGDQTWTTPATSTLSSYSFTSPAQIDSTGVYVGFDTTNGTFGDESYFLIPSWTLEQFSNSDTQNAMRGTKRGFPERSYLIATDKGVDILNADDNTLWMRTEQGSGRSLGADFNNDPSSIFMSHGQLFIGTNGSAGTGLYRYDFNRDKIYRYDATDRRTNTVNIAKRNTSDSSYGSADTAQNLISSVVNDSHALTIQGKLLLAAATDTGVTKISNIFGSDTSYDYSDNASDDYGHVVLAENAGGAGDLYADNDTTDALERWNNVLDDAASETAGIPDTTYDETSTPAIFVTAATEINNISLISQASTVESVSPAVYIAHDLGTTVLAEKRSSPTGGSVKYYTKDYIGEEMVGNISAHWPLNADNTASDLEDISIGAKNFTATNITAADAVTGVRSKATDFDEASEYLTASATVVPAGSKSVGFWIKTTQTSDSGMIMDNNGNNSTQNGFTAQINVTANKIEFRQFKAVSGQNDYLLTSSAAVNDGNWKFIVHTWDGTTGSNKVKIYINGSLDNQTTATSAVNNTPTNNLRIGATSGGSPARYYGGYLDEVFATAAELSATQIQQMYVSGKEALNNKYRVKLASDTVNQLNGATNITKAIAASKLNQTGVTRGEYLYVGTNGTSADDGSLSRILVNGDTRDATYDEANTEPYVVTDNDINSLSVSSDGAYIIVGSDDSGVTIIQSGSSATRMRGGKKTQGGMKRPHN